jgi:hypothetical protein
MRRLEIVLLFGAACLPALATPALVNHCELGIGMAGATTRTCSFTPTAGHAITVEGVSAMGITNAISDSNSAVYTLGTLYTGGPFPINGSAPSAEYNMWYICSYPTTASTTFTLTFGSSSAFSNIAAQEWSGVASTNCYDGGTTLNNASGVIGDVSTGPITFSSSNDLLLAWGNVGAAGGMTAAAGYTIIDTDTFNGYGSNYVIAGLSTAIQTGSVHLPHNNAYDIFAHGLRAAGAAVNAYPLVSNTTSLVRYNDQYNGSNGLPNNGRFDYGDTPHLTTDDAGGTYVSRNDGYGFAVSPSTGACNYSTGENMLLAKWTGAGYLNGSNVNCMTDYCGSTVTNCPAGWTDNRVWKSTGIEYVHDASHAGSLYWWVQRQLDNGPWTGANAYLIRSLDHGASWCRPARSTGVETCSGTPSTTGDVPPSLAETPTLADPKFARPMFVQFDEPSTGATTFQGNSTYLYVMAADSLETSSYLGRCLRSADCTQSGTWQAYTGAIGGDPTVGGNWSSTLSSATLMLFNPQNTAVDVPGANQPKYVAGVGYLWPQTGFTQAYDLSIFWSNSITGPWVMLNPGALAGPTAVKPNYPEIDLHGVTHIGNVYTVPLVQSGDYVTITSNPATNNYAQFTRAFDVTPAASVANGATVSGPIKISGPITIQ